ncbi:MAG: hypothetical protein VW622_04240 [Opitutae bacterium]
MNERNLFSIQPSRKDKKNGFSKFFQANVIGSYTPLPYHLFTSFQQTKSTLKKGYPLNALYSCQIIFYTCFWILKKFENHDIQAFREDKN